MSSNWEFETNSNVTSARILLQRALRLNPESERLWLEYFGLELKFVEKVKQRRRILLGHQEEDAMVPTKSAVTSTTVKADHEDSTEDHIIDGIDLPELEEEKGLVKSDLEKEKLILNQNNEGGENDDDAKLAASNKIIAELAIPRVVYKQAIKGKKNNISFCSTRRVLLLIFGDTIHSHVISLTSLSIYITLSHPIQPAVQTGLPQILHLKQWWQPSSNRDWT